MDIFVEPVLPRPEIVVCGSSPVAVALADLARRLGFSATACAPAAEQVAFPEADRRIEGYALPVEREGSRYIVVSTQGRGDEAALKAALAAEADYVAFVGSRRKAETLRAKLSKDGVDPGRLAGLKAPAGLDLGAITPEEIALSILSEIVAHYRRGRRQSATLRQTRHKARSAAPGPSAPRSRSNGRENPHWHAGKPAGALAGRRSSRCAGCGAWSRGRGDRDRADQDLRRPDPRPASLGSGRQGAVLEGDRGCASGRQRSTSRCIRRRTWRRCSPKD